MSKMTKVVPKSDKLESSSNYKFVGKNCERIDAKDVVTGRAVFLDDYKMKDALICAVLKSPYAHADITKIDTSKAKALSGVHAVLTYEDCDPRCLGMGVPPQKPILGKRVQFAGDGVAIVAADTEEIAKAALDLIEVEYSELPAVFYPVEAVKDGAPQLYDREDFVNNVVPGGWPSMQPDGPWYHIKEGYGRDDSEKTMEDAFAECEFVAEDFVEFAQKPTPLPPESPGVIAIWEGGDNYMVYGTSQSCFIMTIQNETVIPGFRVHAKSFNVGGSYGSKNALVIPCQYCCMLAKATGRPVKWMQSKTEHFVIHETRLGSQIKAKMGCDKEGVIQAIQGVWDVDCGCFSSSTQGQIGVALGESQLFCNQTKHWDLLSNCVVTNKNSAGVVRGYGGQELNACLSLLMTRVMKEANADPVQAFKKNYVHGGSKYTWRDGRKWTCDDSINYDEAIDTAAEKFRWNERWKGWGVPTWESEDGRFKRGIGLSVCGNADVGESWTEGFVHVVPRITEPKSDIILQMDVTESGMGQRSNVLKQVAEILNVPYDMVKITDPDNMFNGTNTGLCGSRGTITCGRAACKAALDVKNQIFELAAPLLHADVQQLELYNFGVRSTARPEEWIPWNILVPQFCTLTGFGRHVENFSTPSCLVTFVEVEVDTKTGLAKVVEVLNGSDAGQIIDPAALEMQLQGAIGSASLDTALFEESITDPATGRLLSCNMIDYKWRPFNEFPPFGLSVIESHMNTYHFKAVGIGENAGAGAASACIMAISNAVGIDIKRYPATPDVILEALAKKEEAK